MIRLLPALSLTLSACVAAPAERPLSVRHVVQNADALDGQIVIVSGWIERCHPRSCALFSSAHEMRKDRPYYLSVGRSSWFDAFAARQAPVRVTLRARVNAHCISDPATGIFAVCADRPGSLEPLSLLR